MGRRLSPRARYWLGALRDLVLILILAVALGYGVNAALKILGW